MHALSLLPAIRFCRKSAAAACITFLPLALGTALPNAVHAQVAQPLTVLHEFGNESTNGAHSVSGLIQGSDGNLYGTSARGGYSNNGTVFQLTPAGVFTVLFGFDGGSDGGEPTAALVAGTDGNFYGTTQFGGYYNEGVAFRITPAGALTVLFDFGGDFGAEPVSSLILGTDGNFYGTTQYGGYYDQGTVFQLTPNGTLNVLFDFGQGYGAQPQTALTLGTDGNFYGTTANGGYYNDGTVFQITTAGTLTVLHDFQGDDGYSPQGALVQLPNAAFYGTTSGGGANDYGTVFQITTSGTLTKLHDFNGADGSTPQAALIYATDGNLYGTTYYGGGTDDGTLYQITPAGAITTLVSLGDSTGKIPAGPLLQALDGTLYGTSSRGGGTDDGTIFQLNLGLPALIQPPGPAAIYIPPAVTITDLGNGTVTEGSGGKGKVLITRTGDTTAPLTIFYQLKGSAQNGIDYQMLSGTAVIPAGQSSVKLKIDPLNDTLIEGAESIKIKLLAPVDSSYSLGSPKSAIVLLLNGD